MIEFGHYKEPVYSIGVEPGQSVNNCGLVMVGKDKKMLNLFSYLDHLSEYPVTVLLRGETGTGKELCAKALHYNNSKSDRRNHNFVAVNCANMPSELLESELFGYFKGAFTNAYKDKEGMFQIASGGTLLLDEIADMSLQLQSKILRVLQEKQLTRLGGLKPENVDVRIVAATNKDLEEEVNQGRFREDLYYRVNVIPLSIPPLRERREDIPLIAKSLLNKYNYKYHTDVSLSKVAASRLMQLDWRGNVRELENIVERICVLKSDGALTIDDINSACNMQRYNNFKKSVRNNNNSSNNREHSK